MASRFALRSSHSKTGFLRSLGQQRFEESNTAEWMFQRGLNYWPEDHADELDVQEFANPRKEDHVAEQIPRRASC